MYQPIIGAGVINVPLEDGNSIDVHINHAHLEEDAGKLTHNGNYSLVDLNRAGTPLIEIVSEPDMHSANEAKAYAMELYHLMTYAGVTQGDLYHGNMRFDVNVSVALNDSNELGTRAEVKNLNSFRSVERATDYEFRRQVELLEKGEKVVQETRGWDEAKQKTTSQRSKEDAQDYRYMPDADIPPIVLTDEEIAEIQANVPRLPNEWRSMLQRLGLDYATIETLISAENEYRGEISLLGVIEDFIDDSEKAKYIANWNVNVFIPLSREESIQLSYENYAEIVSIIYELVKQNKLSSTNAKLLFRELVTSDNLTDIEKYAVDKGYIQVSDENIIIEIVDEVLGEPAFKKAVEDLRNGNDKVIGFLVGQVMKKSGGKANPALVQKIIRDRLKKG
jgi:aspartyl-tRNA(Asn)/glutamyl-tRNA(Gln) amidotransferase subunit B